VDGLNLRRIISMMTKKTQYSAKKAPAPKAKKPMKTKSTMKKK
jgi:hypothetical protein